MNTEVNTIFCLVSLQAMANVLPVLMYIPENVVLFTTPEEKLCADNLETLFQLKGINVLRKDNLDAYDYIKFKETIKKELSNISDNVWLNATGETKLMALAAYEAFTEKRKTIVYCDHEHQNVITLFPQYHSTKLVADLTIEN